MTQLFGDTFDRANSPTIGGNWVEVTQNWDIVSNGVRASGASGGLLINTSTLSTADYKITANITAGGLWSSGGVGMGIIARYVDPNNAYFAWLDGNIQALQLYKFVSGTLIQIGSNVTLAGAVPSDPFNFALGCQGTNLTVEINGVARISQTDSSLTAAGNFGFRVFSPDSFPTHLYNSVSVDDFVSGPVAYPITRGLTQAQAATVQTNVVPAGTTYPLTRALVQAQAATLHTVVIPLPPPSPARPSPTIDQVQAAIAQRLRTVPDLRASATEPDQPNFPIAYPRLVDWTYDISFVETMDDCEMVRMLYHFDLWVLVSLAPNLNRAQTVLNPYLSPVGARSIKKALEQDPSLADCVDYCRVTSGGAYGRSEVGGIACLAASVRLEVYA